LSALTPVSDSPLFPYTTLFRSLCPRLLEHPVEVQPVELPVRLLNELEELDRVARRDERARVTDEAGVEAPHVARKAVVGGVAIRSEEHTSELQSRVALVCRLLL